MKRSRYRLWKPRTPDLPGQMDIDGACPVSFPTWKLLLNRIDKRVQELSERNQRLYPDLK